jgi:diguanylate cyclase (GGDEF)-like protein
MAMAPEVGRMSKAALPAWAWLLALLTYVAAAELGLALAFEGTNASPFWPPTAVAIAMLYHFGLRLWPVVLAGAFIANLVFMLRAGVPPGFGLTASFGVACGNALEAWVAVLLLRRFAGHQFPFDRLRGLAVYCGLSAGVAPAISASIGVTSSRLVDLAGSTSFGENWLTWWVGDASGALSMGPILILLLHGHGNGHDRARRLESTLLALVVVGGSMVAFGIWPEQEGGRYPFMFLLLPMMLWAVLRFHAAGAASAVFTISVIAVVGTLAGGGPFVRADRHESLLLLQLFIIVLAVTSLGLGAVLSERSRLVARLAESNAELHAIAYNDALTGLPNRRTLIDRLHQVVIAGRRHHTHGAVLFVDLDKFKRINDSLGHAVGDALLKKVAERLRASVRESDSVCRLGGDEFVILLSEVDSAADVALVARKVSEQLQVPMRLGDMDLAITSSIGIALIPEDGSEGNELIRCADLAMYRAKERGRNNFQFYTAELNQSAVSRLELEHELRLALQQRQFLLHYQPIVTLADDRVIGIEALLRWRHPIRGLLLPADFIATAEETGLILDIGAWVLREACSQIKELQDAGQGALRLSVNLSPRQLNDRLLPELIATVLRETELDALWLNLEIDERLLREELLAELDFLHRFDRIGISLTVDNFGSAGSSLSLLKRLPVAIIKIDQKLVARLDDDQVARDITLAMIAMAHHLDLAVVAERVESEAQRDFLRANGCDYAQGYLFHRPQEWVEVQRLLVPPSAAVIASATACATSMPSIAAE